MSRTFDLGCDNCNVCLWVGQDTPMRVYTTPLHVERLTLFLRDHAEHSLRIMDTERRPFDWVELYIDGDNADDAG